LVGKSKPTDAEALQLTNSKTVRQIEPGQMVTQDLREDRITIETDPTTGKVVAARCGSGSLANKMPKKKASGKPRPLEV
jgi:hypothetical protein